MRPIDADRVTENLQNFVDWCRDGRRQGAEFCLDCVIPNTPTLDAVPVRHGKWIEQWRTEDTRMLRCSECRMVFNVGNGRDGNYCPNCGARMDEE